MENKVLTGSTDREINNRNKLLEMLKATPVPDSELLSNLGLYLNRQTLSRILFFHELYQKILGIHGVVMEFGVRWGQSLSLFSSFRGIYEPYNYLRKIIGFDTFEGFPDTHVNDGDSITKGDYTVSENYDVYLHEILRYHQNESPISHKEKFELIKGDATKTVKEYLEKNPQTIISLAYFDFDLYEPTKEVLQIILPHLTKGSIIGFDELCMREFPGETIALKEVLGLSKYAIRRNSFNPTPSYLVIE
jgi:hypothetical protein